MIESQSLVFAFLHAFRAVIKISGCWGNDTSRREIQQLGILFGSIFLQKEARVTFIIAGVPGS